MVARGPIDAQIVCETSQKASPFLALMSPFDISGKKKFGSSMMTVLR